MVDLVERVRSSCARVLAEAEFIEIDFDLVSTYDLASPTIPADGPSANRESMTTSEAEARSLLVLALDAINFGSGYHDVIRKRPGQSGATSMSGRLTDYIANTGPLTAARLSAITATDASQIFGQELDGGALEELMDRFTVALNDLGSFLASRHDGSALAFVSGCNQSAVELAEKLTTMPYYRDVERYRGAGGEYDVAFYKRAQISAADLARAGHRFDDLHRLTAFADNLVPHVFRVDGLLRYEPTLASRIDSGERLEHGSKAEIEIRAAAVHVVELLATRTGIRPMDLDLLFWNRGGGARYKAVPRHRARSVYY